MRVFVDGGGGERIWILCAFFFLLHFTFSSTSTRTLVVIFLHHG